MSKHKPSQRLLAMAMSIVMALSMTPVTAMAQTTTDTIGEIIAFEALSEEAANREVPLGTSLEDLNLPGTLNATVRVATSTDAEKPEQDSGKPQFEEKDISVPVTWESEPSYNGCTADTYTFTAEVTDDDYTVSAALPTITVTVLEDSTPPPAKGGEITAFAALAKGIAEQTVPIGTERSVLVLPETLAATVDGKEVHAPVTWEPAPEYLPGGEDEEPGEYLFTARLGEGYTLAEDMSAPEITVITQAEPVMLRGAGELSWETLQTALDEAQAGALIDLSALSTPAESKVYTFMVGDSKTLTLKGSDTQIENVAFVFGANNNITIEDLNIKSAHNHDSNGETDGGEGYSPLHFTGAGNSVTLVGENTVTSGQYDEISPRYGAAVGVPEGAALTITGMGSLNATGGICGVGIGGGSGEVEIVYDDDGETPVDVNIISRGDAGTIEISGGTVTANGGFGSAGIGGGVAGHGGEITINGGMVAAYGGGGAGIGGGTYGNGGSITINNGTVTAVGATGHTEGAGIGGGNGDDFISGGDGGSITINGGTISASGGSGGAGIGGGGGKDIGGGDGKDIGGGDGGSITINGGTVMAYGGNTEHGAGAGIGGGNIGGNGGNITINGGTVTAQGVSGDSAGIGGGYKGAGGIVIITGGSVKATAQNGAEAIGKGEHGTSSGTLKNGAGADVHLNTLIISGAANAPVSNASYGAPAAAYGVTDVKTDGNGKLYFYLPASSGDEAVKITAGGTAYIAQYTRAANTPYEKILRKSGDPLTDWEDVQGEIDAAQSGAVIDLSGLSTPASVYTFMVGDSKTLTLKGSGTQIENVAFVFGANNNITIEDLNIKSAHNHDSNGETDGGEGYSPLHFTGAGNSVTLVGENTVTSGQYNEVSPRYGAAVGVPEGAGLTISTESTGKMTANGGEYGAGIGGGDQGSGGNITISGGTVTANGGFSGAGIGGGYLGSGGYVTISGGIVKAMVEYSYPGAAGIGGGRNGNGGNVTISGGVVTAQGSGSSANGGGAGIGGGYKGNGGTVTISGGTVFAKGQGYSGQSGAGIGGGYKGNGGTVTISGGSIKTETHGGVGGIGAGKNGASHGTLTNGEANVYLNTLTVSGKNQAAVSEAGYGATGTYGTQDVSTDSVGKLYFYLPASTGEEVIAVTADGTGYIAKYTRAADHSNAATMGLSIHSAQIAITGSLAYTGAALEPAITVTLGVTTLEQGTNYTVSYEGTGTNAGDTGKVVITGIGDYGGTAETTFTVEKATPAAISWPTAATITYGQPLSASALSGGSANGTFTWADSALVPNAGTAGYPVTFTPIDTDNYDWSGATLTQNVFVTVSKATFTLPDVQVTTRLITSHVPSAGEQALPISVDLAALVASIKLESDALTYTLGGVTGVNAGYWSTLHAKASGSGVDGLTYSGINGTAGETATFPITVSGFTNYENVTVNVVVTLIEKTTVTIGGLSIADSTYNGSAHAGYTGTPVFTGGNPVITTLTVLYAGMANGGAPYTSTIPPTNAGSYTVTVSLADDALYKGVWGANFTIAKAAQSAPPAPELDGNVTATTVKVQAPSGVSGIVQFACKTGNDAPLDGDWKASGGFDSLNPNTEYRFYMRYAADANHEASPASPALTVTTRKAVLTGTVSINGTMKYGETLTANTTALTSNPSISDLGTLSYWWRNSDGGAVLGTGETYTVQEGNIGKRIRVTVTAENCEGFLSHTPSTPVAKADGPAAPTVTGGYTGNGSTFTYTVTPIAGAEYQVDGGEWQEENVFTGITPLSSHTFYARMKETDTHEAGAAGNTGAVSFVKLNDRSAPALGYTVSGSFPHKTVTITMVSGAEYKFGTGEWSDTNTCTSAEAEEITLYIRLKETATHNASADSSVTVNTANQNQDAPPAFTLSHADVNETSYTVTIPATAGAEYSFDGTNWNDSNSKAGFMPGETVTGYKRMAEREGFNASPAVSASVTLPLFRAKQPIASPNGGAFTSSQSVMLSSATADAKIYYTTNGDTPTIGSTLYTTAIHLTATTTIKAIAVKAGMTDSPVLTVTFTKQSGGSGGGGGGGGYTPPSTPTTPEKKPDQPVTATAPVTTTAGSNGSASANIPASAITDAIAKAQAAARAQGNTANGISVELNVTMPQGATSLTATIPQSALQSLVTAGVSQLEISGVPVSLSLNQRALQSIQSQASGGITISITPATGLSASARAAIGNRPVYHITISYTDKDGKTQNITSFGSGTATLAIPYAPGRNEAAGYLYGVYVDGNGNVARIPGSVYDANSRSILVPTNHLSVYGVGYEAPSAKFTDIGNHWGKEAIDYVVGRGLLSGTSKTTFAPDKAMTRGMLVTALGRLAGVDTKLYTTNSFTDVKADSAFRPYIEWAYKKGVVQGIGNGQFAPDRAITREEIAVIFANFAKATGYKLPVTRTATTFADAPSIGSAYKSAVTAMQQAGIMMGEQNNKFNPTGNTTRAEASAMLHRYIKLTIAPATAQGWAKNDDGQFLYYKNGKALTGTQTIDGVKYFFNTDGSLKTGWVKDDAGNWRFYSGNQMLVGFWDLGANGNNKTYYFNKDGIMVAGKWLQIDGKWYYFYADGSLARSVKIDEYEVDENGVRKVK